MKIVAAIKCRTLFCAAALLLLTGCVGVIPRPVSGTKVEYGHQLKPCDTASIKPGVTTRAEVLARLGNDAVALPTNRALAYTWEMSGGGGVWWVAFAWPGAGEIHDADTWEGGWRGFFIAFDDFGVVTATAHKRLSLRRSLHVQLGRNTAELAGSGFQELAISVFQEEQFGLIVLTNECEFI